MSKSINRAKVTLPVPSELVPEIVNSLLVNNTVGVPVMAPVAVLKLNPAGSVGLIANEFAVPPELLTTIVGRATLITP